MMGITKHLCFVLLLCVVSDAFPADSADGPVVDQQSLPSELRERTVASTSSKKANLTTTSSLFFKDTKPILTYLLGGPKKHGSLSSPAQLLSPDRYEFFTFDDDGQIVKKLMSVKEIQKIIANTDKATAGEQSAPIEYYQILTVTPDVESIPSVSRINPHEPLFSIHDVIASVQNVLKSEMNTKHGQSKLNDTKFQAGGAAADYFELFADKVRPQQTVEVQKVTSTTSQKHSTTNNLRTAGVANKEGYLNVETRVSSTESHVAVPERQRTPVPTEKPHVQKVSSTTAFSTEKLHKQKLSSTTSVPKAKPVSLTASPSSQAPVFKTESSSPSTQAPTRSPTPAELASTYYSVRDGSLSSSSTPLPGLHLSTVASSSVPDNSVTPLSLLDAHPAILSNDTFLDKPLYVPESVFEEVKLTVPPAKDSVESFVKAESLTKGTVHGQQAQTTALPNLSSSSTPADQLAFTPDLANSVSSVLWQIASENALLDNPTEATPSSTVSQQHEQFQVSETKYGGLKNSLLQSYVSSVGDKTENPIILLENILRPQNRPRPFLATKTESKVEEGLKSEVSTTAAVTEKVFASPSTVVVLTETEEPLRVDGENDNQENVVTSTTKTPQTFTVSNVVSDSSSAHLKQGTQNLGSSVTSAGQKGQGTLQGVQIIEEGFIGQIPRSTQAPEKAVQQVQEHKVPEFLVVDDESLNEPKTSTVPSQTTDKVFSSFQSVATTLRGGLDEFTQTAGSSTESSTRGASTVNTKNTGVTNAVDTSTVKVGTTDFKSTTGFKGDRFSTVTGSTSGSHAAEGNANEFSTVGVFTTAGVSSDKFSTSGVNSNKNGFSTVKGEGFTADTSFSTTTPEDNPFSTVNVKNNGFTADTRFTTVNVKNEGFTSGNGFSTATPDSNRFSTVNVKNEGFTTATRFTTVTPPSIKFSTVAGGNGEFSTVAGNNGFSTLTAANSNNGFGSNNHRFSTVNSQSTEFSTVSSQNNKFSSVTSQNNQFENVNSQNSQFNNANSQSNQFSTVSSQNNQFGNANSQNNQFSTVNSQNNQFSTTSSQNNKFGTVTSQNNQFENVNSQNNQFDTVSSQNNQFSTVSSQNNKFGAGNSQNSQFSAVNSDSNPFSTVNSQNNQFGNVNSQNSQFGTVSSQNNQFTTVNSQNNQFSSVNSQSNQFGNVNAQNSQFGAVGSQNNEFSTVRVPNEGSTTSGFNKNEFTQSGVSDNSFDALGLIDNGFSTLSPSNNGYSTIGVDGTIYTTVGGVRYDGFGNVDAVGNDFGGDSQANNGFSTSNPLNKEFNTVSVSNSEFKTVTDSSSGFVGGNDKVSTAGLNNGAFQTLTTGNNGFSTVGFGKNEFSTARPSGSDGFSTVRTSVNDFSTASSSGDRFSTVQQTNEFSTSSNSGFSTSGVSNAGFTTIGLSTDGFSTAKPLNDRFSTVGVSGSDYSTLEFSGDAFTTVSPASTGFTTASVRQDGFSTGQVNNNEFSTVKLTTNGFSTVSDDGFSTNGLSTAPGPVQRSTTTESVTLNGQETRSTVARSTENYREATSTERVDITFVPMLIKTPSEFKTEEETVVKAEGQSVQKESLGVSERTRVTSDVVEDSSSEEKLESKVLPEDGAELKSNLNLHLAVEQKTVTGETKSEGLAEEVASSKQNVPVKTVFVKPQKTGFKPVKVVKPVVRPVVKDPVRETETKKPYENHLQSSPTVLELEAAPAENLGLEATITTLDKDVRAFTDLCNELAFSLWSSVTHNGLSFVRSVVISPFAVTSLLAMVFLGARGPTSGQMNDILKLDDMVTFNPHLVFRNVTESLVISRNPGVATAAFVRELYSDKSKGKLLDFYKERVQQFYDGHVEEINFKAVGDVLRRQTNHLVKRQTWGKITDFLRGSNLTPRPPLAAFSANIFQTDCSKASTKDRDGEMYFVILPASRLRRLVPIPAVVWRSDFLAGYEPGLDATAVSISPANSAVSTIFVLPGQQGLIAPGDTLARLEHHLLGSSYKKGHWSRLMRSLLPRPGLELQIPRMSHKSVINVTSSLQRMGLKDLFSAEKADLTGLNGLANDLHLSDMLQVNLFSTCGEEPVSSRHHSEVYPATANLRREKSADGPFAESVDSLFAVSDFEDPAISALPLELRPRQARVPLSKPGARIPEPPRLRFDRPFLFFVRHNPTGLILHMGRFNPRLMP